MLIVLLCVSIGLVYWIYQRALHKSKQPPSLPGGYPIIGHAHLLLFGRVDQLWDKFLFVIKGSLQTGGTAVTSFGPWNVYVATDPEVCATVMNSCLEKDILYDFWYSWLGHGLLTAPVALWRPHRKMILPSFNLRLLEDFIDIFNYQSRRLVYKLSERVTSGPFDIFHDLAIIGIHTICMSSMGLQSELDEALIMDYLEAVSKYHKITTERSANAFYHSYFIYKWTAGKKVEDGLLNNIKKLSTTIIEKRKVILSKENNNNYKTNEKEKNGKISLDMLLEMNEKGIISEKQLKDEVDTLIFGGHDTSAATMTYLLILVGSYPHVQDRLLAEIEEVFDQQDEDVRKEHLPKLVYLEAVIKESMRMYPYISFLPRTIDKDLKLKNFTLTAGSRCLMSVYGMHRHPVWGPDAEMFRPERWLPPASIPDCPAAFAGFSWGKRGCIGKTYAMMSMKTNLVHLFRQYKFSADHPNLQLKFEAVLKPKSGHLVSVERRR